MTYSPWFSLLYLFHRNLVWVVFAMLWCVVGACAPKPDERCKEDRDCSVGKICVDTICVIPDSCVADVDCPLYRVCSFTQCRPGCRTHDDCKPNTWCENKTCIATENMNCKSDSDCPVPARCDLAKGTCSKTD